MVTELRYQPEFEEMRYVPGAVITRVLWANQSRSALSRLTSSPLYSQVTVRNVNTARALAGLL